MNRKLMAIVLLVGGVLLFLVSAAADTLGIGGAPGFGWKQVAGVVIGVVASAAGMRILRAQP